MSKNIPFVVLTHVETIVCLTRIFDGMKHGYDAMFCAEPCDDATRELRHYKYHSGKVQITFGYSIDYEDEREE